MHVALYLLSLFAIPSANAAHITFSLAPSPIYNPSTLLPSTQTILYKFDTHRVAPITRRNTFEYRDVESGSYLLTVQCRDFSFPPLRVDVIGNGTDEAGHELHKVDAWQTFWGNEWGNKGEHRGGGVVPAISPEEQAVVIELKVGRSKDYYQQRQGFSPFQFLKSPMILMALASLALIVGMPYLMDNMDEETKAEFEEMQKKNPVSMATNPAAKLQDFDLAGWMAGKTVGNAKTAS